MMLDFNNSAQIQHSGVKGDFREDTLKDFLLDGRLPEKYGIGSGVIISPTGEVSKQSDLIIYDKQNCPLLLQSDSNQVFPIESVYCVIEVKSKLSKTELVNAMENIAMLKNIVPKNQPSPLGIVFAYSLAGNSLDSIESNICEFEEGVDSLYWTNFVAVLNEGIVHHVKYNFVKTLYNEHYRKGETFTSRTHYKNDTLMEFYLLLFSHISDMSLPHFEIHKYKELPIKVGKYNVLRHQRILNKDNERTIVALNEACIDRIYSHCKRTGKMPYGQILHKQLGRLPLGSDDPEIIDVNHLVYFYNPEDLPGLGEFATLPFIEEDGFYSTSQRMLIPSNHLIINGEVFIVPEAYYSIDDFDTFPDMQIEDIH